MKKIEIVTGIGLITILCLCYFQFRPNAAAQVGSDSDVSSLQQRINNGFFDTLSTQASSADAYQRLFSGSQSQIPDIQDMAKKTEDMMKEGTRWRHEFMDAKTIGNDLILIRYLYKSDTHPVIWYFTFYRSQSGLRWNCINVRFSTNLDSLFQESWPK